MAGATRGRHLFASTASGRSEPRQPRPEGGRCQRPGRLLLQPKPAWAGKRPRLSRDKRLAPRIAFDLAPIGRPGRQPERTRLQRRSAKHQHRGLGESRRQRRRPRPRALRRYRLHRSGRQGWLGLQRRPRLHGPQPGLRRQAGPLCSTARASTTPCTTCVFRLSCNLASRIRSESIRGAEIRTGEGGACLPYNHG